MDRRKFLAFLGLAPVAAPAIAKAAVEAPIAEAPVVHIGVKPAFVLLKDRSSGQWHMEEIEQFRREFQLKCLHNQEAHRDYDFFSSPQWEKLP